MGDLQFPNLDKRALANSTQIETPTGDPLTKNHQTRDMFNTTTVGGVGGILSQKQEALVLNLKYD
jgi:hypothetical protein